MKTLLIVLSLFTASLSNAQYYYKDIIGTQETAILIKSYMNNKVVRVVISSYDADNTRNDDFHAEQVFDPNTNTLRTITRSGVSAASVLISFADAGGNVLKTIDSSETSISISEYSYSPEGLLTSVTSTSGDTALKMMQIEEHNWQYENGRPGRMLRIKNKRDTSIVTFKTDDAGNIIEEQVNQKGVQPESVYYYYDNSHRLTDIVRFSRKAKRLLPEYMFEYSPANRVIQKITVPANSSDYLIWRYQYNSNGLKTKEAVYNKQKQLTGKIEYVYSFLGSGNN